MTNVHKRADRDGTDPDSLVPEGSTGITSGERMADAKRKLKSAPLGTQDPKPTLPESSPSESSQDSDEESKPFDFGGLPDRNLKKNLGCG
ncbi:MAG TPA: hypothetical protein VK658_02785 [Chryseolinea sp.]|nr:hypothetical protein [Chryseolinea sp.]